MGALKDGLLKIPFLPHFIWDANFILDIENNGNIDRSLSIIHLLFMENT